MNLAERHIQALSRRMCESACLSSWNRFTLSRPVAKRKSFTVSTRAGIAAGVACRPSGTTLGGLGPAWREALFQAVKQRLSHECDCLDVLTVACAHATRE